MIDERLEVRPQELPADPAEIVLLVEPDMAPPHHLAAEMFRVLGQPGGLRVVQHDDVAGAGVRRQRIALRLQRGVVDAVLRLAEFATVTRGAVQVVVQPLRHLEELRVAVDHHPPSVDADPADQAEQHVQHLGDATPGRRRVHVDHAAPAQSFDRLACRLDGEQVGPVLPDQRGVPERVAWRDRHVFHAPQSGARDRSRREVA